MPTQKFGVASFLLEHSEFFWRGKASGIKYATEGPEGDIIKWIS